ncbi:Protein-export membrane protein SecF [uncultured archaeon]|nr:Protein-export membrane protein SecF [uncultured archaeon]
MKIPNIYAHPHYRRLFIIPVVLVALSLIAMLFVSPIRLGIDFKGGIDITIQSNSTLDTAALQTALQNGGYHVDSLTSKPNPGGWVTQAELERSETMVKADALKADFYDQLDAAANDEAALYFTNSSDGSIDPAAQAKYAASRAVLNRPAEQLFNLAANAPGSAAPVQASSFNTTTQLSNAVARAYSDLSNAEQARLHAIISTVTPVQPSIEEVTASLSSKFFQTAIMVVIFSILLTTAVVFVIFRTITPSIAVLTGALSDVLLAMGAMAIFGIPLTLASFSALLMLVGFSLDTDVLLSMRVLKRKEDTPAIRAYHAMETGMTMSLSAIVAFSALFVLAMVTHIPTYYEISAVVLAGLVADLVATWCFNAVIVLHYVEERQKKGAPPSDRPLLSYFFKN